MSKNPQFKKSYCRRDKPIFIEYKIYVYNYIHNLDKNKIELYTCKESVC